MNAMTMAALVGGRGVKVRSQMSCCTWEKRWVGHIASHRSAGE